MKRPLQQKFRLFYSYLFDSRLQFRTPRMLELRNEYALVRVSYSRADKLNYRLFKILMTATVATATVAKPAITSKIHQAFG